MVYTCTLSYAENKIKYLNLSFKCHISEHDKIEKEYWPKNWNIEKGKTSTEKGNSV